MKKSIVILLVALIALSSVFAAASTMETKAKVAVGLISKTAIIKGSDVPAKDAAGWTLGTGETKYFGANNIQGETLDVSTQTSYTFTVATLTNVEGERKLTVSITDFIQKDGTATVDSFASWIGAKGTQSKTINDGTSAADQKGLRVIGDSVTVSWSADDVKNATSGDYICTVTLSYTQD